MFLIIYFDILTLFRMGLFKAAHERGVTKKAPHPKVCQTYPTMMKLGTVVPYLKKIQKQYKSPDTPLSFAENRIFLLEISNFCYIKKYRYRLLFNT